MRRNGKDLGYRRLQQAINASQYLRLCIDEKNVLEGKLIEDFCGYKLLVCRDGKIYRIDKKEDSSLYIRYLEGTNKREDGYKVAVFNYLNNDGDIEYFNVLQHRLVAMVYLREEYKSFVKKCGAKNVVVNHKNNCSFDNRVENLEWCTFGENIRHGRMVNMLIMRDPDLKNEDTLNNRCCHLPIKKGFSVNDVDGYLMAVFGKVDKVRIDDEVVDGFKIYLDMNRLWSK